jgi:hypothetical protein
MFISFYNTEDCHDLRPRNDKLWRLSTEHDLKKQSQYAGLCPEIRSTKLEIRNEWKGYDLKKQSQFHSGQIGLKSYLKGIYDNIPSFRAWKNKANLSLRERSQLFSSEFCVLRAAFGFPLSRE